MRVRHLGWFAVGLLLAGAASSCGLARAPRRGGAAIRQGAVQPSKGAGELFLDLDAVLADAEADADAGGSGDQMLFSMDGSDAGDAYEKDAIDERIDRLAQAMQLKDFDDEGDDGGAVTEFDMATPFGVGASLPPSAPSAYSSEGGFVELEPAQLLDRMQHTFPPLLVDVRSAKEYADVHLDKAINVPLEELGDACRAGRFDEWRDEGEVVCVCASGARSAQAAVKMRKVHGFASVASLRGGMQAMEAALAAQDGSHGGGGGGCGCNKDCGCD